MIFSFSTNTLKKSIYMRKYLLSLLTLVPTIATFGQQTFKRNDIYFELGGNGIGASICYERHLASKPGFGLKAGIGSFSGDGKFRVSIPLGVNYLFMLTSNKSFLEAGIGGTRSGATGLKNEPPDYSERIWSFVPSLGFRQHANSTFMWRISFTPIINKYEVMPWFGFSMGKRF